MLAEIRPHFEAAPIFSLNLPHRLILFIFIYIIIQTHYTYTLYKQTLMHSHTLAQNAHVDGQTGTRIHISNTHVLFSLITKIQPFHCIDLEIIPFQFIILIFVALSQHQY